jgi:hypothetical protein
MKNNVVISKYMPMTLNMHIDMNSIYESEQEVKMINIIDYPKCSFGFHHFIHSLKKDSEILKQFENKKKVYLVTNQFEIEVDNYDNSILKEVNKFLQIKDKVPQIISQDYYKIWEILFMFDIVDIDIELKSLYINDDGSSIQSVMYFREKYAKNTKNDQYNILKNEKINTEFLNYYTKSKNIIHNDKISDKNDLIIAGIDFNYENENLIEQEYFKTMFINLLNIIKYQKKNGNSIIKIFETFTNLSAKYIAILNALYDKIFIVKPLTSRNSSSEKFIICIGFKFNDKDKEYNNILKKTEAIIDLINKNPKLRICDVFTKYDLNHSFKIRMIKLNTLMSNMYFKAIGENVNFVNGQNYYGDKYQEYRDAQIEANNYWVETFMPDSKDFKEMKKKITENSFNSNKINMDESIRLEKEIK